jgi:hypothetical protein
MAAAMVNQSVLFGDQEADIRKEPELPKEIGIEDASFRDPIDGKVIALCRSSDRLRIRTVVNAVASFLVVADIGVDPGHPMLGISINNAEHGGRSFVVDRNVETLRECPLDQITSHSTSSTLSSAGQPG